MGSLISAGIIAPIPMIGAAPNIDTRNASRTIPMETIFPFTGLVIILSNFDSLYSVCFVSVTPSSCLLTHSYFALTESLRELPSFESGTELNLCGSFSSDAISARSLS